MDRLFPIMLNLKQRQVLVVGGGAVANRKVKALLEAGATVTLASPSLVPELTALVAGKDVIYWPERYKREHLQGCCLCFACTQYSHINAQIALDCRGAGIFFTRADEQGHTDFITPANLQRGDLSIAVSTGGGSPALARRIKDKLAMQYPAEWEKGLAMVGEARQKIISACPDAKLRRQILQTLGSEDVVAMIERADWTALENLLNSQLDELK